MNTTLGALIAALAFAGMIAYGIKTGRAPLRRPLSARRDTHPVAFWLVLLVYAAVALFCLWTAYESIAASTAAATSAT